MKLTIMKLLERVVLVIINYLIYTLIVLFLASIPLSFIGFYLYDKDLSNVSDSTSHVAMGGVAIGYLVAKILSLNFIFTWVIMLTIVLVFLNVGEYLNSKRGIKYSSILSMQTSLAAALIAVIFSLKLKIGIDLHSFLFGNLSLISLNDVIILLVAVIVFSVYYMLSWKKILLVSISPMEAKLRGISVTIVNHVMISLIGIFIIILVQILGSFLITSLISLPIITSNIFSRTYKEKFFNAFMVILTSLLLGYLVSLLFGISATGMMVIIEMIILVFSIIYKKYILKGK